MSRVRRRTRTAAALASLLVLAACGGDDASPGATDSPPAATSVAPGGGVTLKTPDFKFEPSDLKLTKGKKVTVTMTNTGNSIHNFQSKDFKVDKDVAAGKTVTFELNPIAAGTFEYVCKYHLAQNMRGYLIIS